MADEKRTGIPSFVGQASGLFAGATVGWSAGQTLGDSIIDYLPGPLHDHASLLSDAIATTGAFGCAYAGVGLARNNPAEALLAAAAVASRYGASQAPANISEHVIETSNNSFGHPIVISPYHDFVEADTYIPDDHSGVLGIL